MKNITLLLLLIFSSITLKAQDSKQNIEEQHKPEKLNTFGFFTGHTIIAQSGFQLPTVGVEYLREVNHWLEVGLTTELEIGSHIIQTNEDGAVILEVERESSILILPSVFINVYKGLILTAGYGIELEKSENLALLKLGVEYRLKMHNPNWILLPQVSWDHTKLFDGVVYGITFGYKF